MKTFSDFFAERYDLQPWMPYHLETMMEAVADYMNEVVGYNERFRDPGAGVQ